MEYKDWLVVFATLVGPILAVQAQKWVELSRERRGRKMHIFQALMATRSTRLSFEHVQALNMIDVVFYGGIFGKTQKEKEVMNSWKEYHDHLNDVQANQTNADLWLSKGGDLFANLLFAISQDLGYSYDKVQLSKGAYSPMAHSNIENEQSALRKHVIEVFSGQKPFKMSVIDFPAHPDAVAALESQKQVCAKLTAALEGKGALTVKVDEPKKP